MNEEIRVPWEYSLKDDKLIQLLDLVIESYISKWDPIWSKFLFSLEELDYAPSTLRKYLNVLEKEWFLYQPYNSAGRIPTVKAFSMYIDTILEQKSFDVEGIDFDLDFARNWVRFIVEKLGNVVDGAVAGFLRNDDYYFLWINNLLTQDMTSEAYDTVRSIVKFIEDKKIIEFLNEKLIKQNKIYYTFVQEEGEKVISIIYVKINVNWFDGILSVVWPVRIDYKKNLWTLQKFLNYYKY